jgi:hypothetical protein
MKYAQLLAASCAISLIIGCAKSDCREDSTRAPGLSQYDCVELHYSIDNIHLKNAKYANDLAFSDILHMSSVVIGGRRYLVFTCEGKEVYGLIIEIITDGNSGKLAKEATIDPIITDAPVLLATDPCRSMEVKVKSAILK